MKLYQTLESQLKKEPNYVSDNGELKKWVVLNKAQNFDEELIGLLLDDSDLKEKFFINVKESLSEDLVLMMDSSLFLELTTSEYRTTAMLLVIVQIASEKVIPMENIPTAAIPSKYSKK